MSNCVNIRQINLNRSLSALSELEIILHRAERTVVLLQEPALRQGRVVGVKNFRTYAAKNARAAILVSVDLDAVPLANFTSEDRVVCQLTSKEREG